MIRHYFKIALRTLGRHPGYTTINGGGLGIGIAACLLISTYVLNETSVDRGHQHGDRIFRLVLDAHTPEGIQRAAVSALPFGRAMKDEFPEIEEVARFRPGQALFSIGDKRIQEERLLFADNTYFQVFTAPLQSGDRRTALDSPFRAVLTQEAALKYFGRTDVVGERLTMDNANDVVVTGVLGDVPSSHLQFDALLSFSTWEVLNPDVLNNWTWYNFYTYFLLRDARSRTSVESKIPDFVERHTAGLPVEENIEYDFSLQPLSEIYLYSDRFAEVGITGNRNALILFGVIALLILIVAGINFTNLSTARSIQRAREVGVRKAVGAGQIELVGQFLGEALLMSFLSSVLAVVLYSAALPVYNALLGQSGSPGSFLFGPGGIALFAMTILIGLFAGIYPAFVMSRYRLGHATEGLPISGKERNVYQRGLVVFQFAVSAFLIVGTLIIYAQLDFLRSQNLGFDTEQVLTVNFRNDSTAVRQYETLKSVMLQHPAVVAATVSDFVPGSPMGATTAHISLGDGNIVHSIYPYGLVDYDFFPAYGIEFAAGRNFSRSFGADATEAFIVNEAVVRHLGFPSPEDALGKRVQQWGRDGAIIGVVKDFNFKSLHQSIEPLILHIRPDWFRYLSLRIRTDDMQRVVAELDRTWQALVPGRPFEFAFLDDQFNRQYRNDERFGRLIVYFAGLALFIACMGLFGLAAFSMERRIKEVGVRKVLGASVGSIVLLFSREYARLIGVALGVAIPVGFFAMRYWLSGFAYRVSPSPLLFLAAGIIVTGIAWATVGYHAIRAALSNPVEALRYE